MKWNNYLVILFFAAVLAAGCTPKKPKKVPPAAPAVVKVGKPEFVRGIHLSCWTAGEPKFLERFDKYFGRDKLNTVVVAVKEYEGEVCVPGVKLMSDYGVKPVQIKNLVPDIKYLKSKKVYTIARIVVFKDKQLAKKNPKLAVKRPDGSIWRDRRGNCWADPYDMDVWKYNVEIAKKAVEMGFEEIQFDYVRFPSDGDIKSCRYSQAHSTSSAAAALRGFLIYARQNIPAPISVDVFGLTPSVTNDMGIGQRFLQLAEIVDFVSPMTYPSHYAKYEYGIKDPNSEPYKVVSKTISDANKLLKEHPGKLRPYLQDFSMGYKYGPEEVKAQIKACYDNGVYDWLLWDPKCKYTLDAIDEMVKFRPPKQTVKASTSQAGNSN